MPLKPREVAKHSRKARKLMKCLDSVFREDSPGGKKITVGEAFKIISLATSLAFGLSADFAD